MRGACHRVLKFCSQDVKELAALVLLVAGLFWAGFFVRLAQSLQAQVIILVSFWWRPVLVLLSV